MTMEIIFRRNVGLCTTNDVNTQVPVKQHYNMIERDGSLRKADSILCSIKDEYCDSTSKVPQKKKASGSYQFNNTVPVSKVGSNL